MIPEEHLLLASRLRQAQPDLDEEVLGRVLAAVAADDHVREIALRWARQEDLPTEPDVEGLNPASLLAHFKPSVALSALPQLLSDPPSVLESLRHPPAGWMR